MTHPCAQCGTPLYGSRTDTLYCSSACRQRAYRQRKDPTPTIGDRLDMISHLITELLDDVEALYWPYTYQPNASKIDQYSFADSAYETAVQAREELTVLQDAIGGLVDERQNVAGLSAKERRERIDEQEWEDVRAARHGGGRKMTRK